jgi:hypothetical protein
MIININRADIRVHMPGNHDNDIAEQVFNTGAAFKYPIQLADVQQ